MPTILQNQKLSLNTLHPQFSTICEPSIAGNGQYLFYTGNWFAARSKNGGRTWKYINPHTYLPLPGTPFDCDQTCIHDSKRNLVFWLSQYEKDLITGENTLRLAVDKDDLTNWNYWDFQPYAINKRWRGEWFDYNHAALSDHYLYIGTNMYRQNYWRRSVIFRIPLSSFNDPTAPLYYDYFESRSHGSLRCTQGATDTMYIAGKQGDNRLKLFEWPETSQKVENEYNIKIDQYSLTNGFVAKCPDGNNWLSRCDHRITAAWATPQHLGFMWSADRLGDERPYPYIKAVRLNIDDFSLLDEPDIWSANQAYAYPDANVNGHGEVGITFFRGGGKHYPSHVVGVLQENPLRWNLKVATKGTHAPDDQKWGDYLTCRPHPIYNDCWIATGFTLQGGDDYRHIEPKVVTFKA